METKIDNATYFYQLSKEVQETIDVINQTQLYEESNFADEQYCIYYIDGALECFLNGVLK